MRNVFPKTIIYILFEISVICYFFVAGKSRRPEAGVQHFQGGDKFLQHFNTGVRSPLTKIFYSFWKNQSHHSSIDNTIYPLKTAHIKVFKLGNQVAISPLTICQSHPLTFSRSPPVRAMAIKRITQITKFRDKKRKSKIASKYKSVRFEDVKGLLMNE